MRSRRSQKLSHTQTSVPCGTLNYKSQGKMLRKKFKSYKPFWNSELTSLWKNMCHKERSARCLTSNLQHKKSLRMKFSTERKTFDKDSDIMNCKFFKSEGILAKNKNTLSV